MKNLFDLTGKVVLVTGGSRGLGRGLVKGFAEAGADVAIVSRKLENCREVARETEALGVKAFPYGCHIGHWDEIEPMFDAVWNHFGKVDVVVNNAGMSPTYPSLYDVNEKLFDSVVGLNFKGPFRLASQVAHRMAQGEGGSIINVSSTASIRPTPGVVPYSGAKAALNAMTVSMSREYAPKVRVNTIVPGPFLTDIALAWTPEARERANNALGRPGRPEEIVTAALYLASPASSFTTGTLIQVDGGS